MFESLFMRTVQRCVVVRLVDGSELHVDDSLVDAYDQFFHFYKERWPHSSLADATPEETYHAMLPAVVD
jgi:hypothetical protein